MFRCLAALFAVFIVSALLKFGQWLCRDIDFNNYHDTE